MLKDTNMNTVTIKNGEKSIIVTAKASCRKCFGRGWIGSDPAKKGAKNDEDKVVCSCIVNKYKKMPQSKIG